MRFAVSVLVAHSNLSLSLIGQPIASSRHVVWSVPDPESALFYCLLLAHEKIRVTVFPRLFTIPELNKY